MCVWLFVLVIGLCNSVFASSGVCLLVLFVWLLDVVFGCLGACVSVCLDTCCLCCSFACLLVCLFA